MRGGKIKVRVRVKVDMFKKDGKNFRVDEFEVQEIEAVDMVGGLAVHPASDGLRRKRGWGVSHVATGKTIIFAKRFGTAHTGMMLLLKENWYGFKDEPKKIEQVTKLGRARDKVQELVDKMDAGFDAEQAPGQA